VLPWAIAGAAIVVAVLVLVPLFRGQAPLTSGPQSIVGRRAPAIELRDDRGVAVSLAQYRGKVVLMNLWASWCPPCREEMPDLQRLYSADVRRGLMVIGVDQGESAQQAQRFASALGVTYPIWLDSAQDYGRAYEALGLPTTVLIDRRGAIVRGFDGALTYGQMQSIVAPLLSPR
jgi:peroxiredoxin